MSTISFPGRILVLGYGSVSQCTLPLILRHLGTSPERITVLDFVDCRKALAGEMARGVRFVRKRITPENYEQELATYLGSGDLLIDLAWNIDCGTLLDFCRRHDVMYVNTSVEVWDPYSGIETKTPPERTLYARHMALRKLIAGWPAESRPTAILDHGANPGLVSHFTKLGLIDIARKIIAEKPDDPRRALLEEALAAGQFNRLAQAVRLRVIHVSERDTQISNKRRRGNEFVNTWSVEGFFEEGVAPAEMGWGTHERKLPHDAWRHTAGPRNQICLERFGMNAFVRSRVPSSEIVGMIIRHGEAFSISEFLTIKGPRGKAIYRPTVHYAYLPCEYAVASLDEVREQSFVMHEKWRIMRDEIVCGYDELGVLLMGHDFQSWWCGTILDIDEARRLVPGQNATTLQVAASIVSAAAWMIKNPRRGVLLPDELPHEEILALARPYLGKVISIPIAWTPVEISDEASVMGTSDDVWQFSNFLLEPMSSHVSSEAVIGPQLLKEYCDPVGLPV
ncbi:MAG TPA: saccharopine dehydrogenase NADP-binding domain-containing protein [Planctomycetaceae bacterium]|nr:saccharopine dehydrogenase NADP-binding domain-containing protein [Planctomycetaceae bacterium]